MEKKLKENILLEDVLTKLLEKNEELYKFEKNAGRDRKAKSSFCCSGQFP